MPKPHVFVADWLLPDFELEADRFDRAAVTWSLPDAQSPPLPVNGKREKLMSRIAATSSIDAVLFQLAPLASEVISALPDTCKILQRVGIGLDTVDLPTAAQRGIPVKNTPDYAIEEVAVHAMTVLLSMHRQLNGTQTRLLAGEWSDRTPNPTERLSTLTLGIVGFGRIGQKLGELMKPLVGRVLYADPAVVDAPVWADSANLDELFSESDLISLHCPLIPETRHLINSTNIARMKPTALLANTARGGLIEVEALVSALREQRLAGAGLDVFEPEILPDDSPLRACENVILTSHTAWYSRQSIVDARTTAIDNVLSAILAKDGT